jgi:hypothetical protein
VPLPPPSAFFSPTHVANVHDPSREDGAACGLAPRPVLEWVMPLCNAAVVCEYSNREEGAEGMESDRKMRKNSCLPTLPLLALTQPNGKRWRGRIGGEHVVCGGVCSRKA